MRATAIRTPKTVDVHHTFKYISLPSLDGHGVRHPAYCRRLRRVCLESLDFKTATAAEGSYIKSTRVISGFIAIIPNNGELNWS